MKLLIVAGAALLLSACGSTVLPGGRALSVTVNATDVAATHGAIVCLGQPGSDPPRNQCATTNDQGVAQVPLDELAPGRYGIIIFCNGAKTSHYVTDGFSDRAPALITIPANGTPEPQSVHDACTS